MARYSTKIKPKKPQKKNLTPLWLALAGVVFLAFAGWAMINGNNQPKVAIDVNGASHLKVEKDKIDRGNVKLGTTIRDDVKITNTGDQPLRFTEAPYVEVKEGC